MFNPLHELSDKIGRKHAMAAHGGNLERLPVGHAVRLPEKPQGIFDAVPFQARAASARLSFVKRRADIDG